MLGGHISPFSDPHPMLAGGRTPKTQSPGHHCIDHPVDFLPFFFVALFACNNQVNVAVPGVAEGITNDFVSIDLMAYGFNQLRVFGIWYRHIR